MLDPALLDRHPLLDGAGPHARRELAARGVERRYAAGQTIFSAGTPSRGLFAVVEGRVRVTRQADGRGRVVHVEGPGGTLGEVPLFAGGGYPATAVAAAPTRCLVFDRGALSAAIAAEPGLAWALLARLASRVRQLVDRLDDLTAQRTTARLAAHLLGRAAAAGPGRPFTLGGTQAEVAEELGTVREVVVRGLRALRAAGAITAVARGRYAVADAAELRRCAGGRG